MSDSAARMTATTAAILAAVAVLLGGCASTQTRRDPRIATVETREGDGDDPEGHAAVAPAGAAAALPPAIDAAPLSAAAPAPSRSPSGGASAGAGAARSADAPAVRTAESPRPRSCAARVGEHGVRRSALSRTLDAGLGQWLRGVDVEPQIEGGRFRGWRVRGLHAGDPCWDDVGLHPGDVVSRINRRPLERPEQAHAVWIALRTAQQIVVDYVRGGRPGTLRFDVIDDDGSGGGGAERPR